jgi:hypothetical protein
MKCFEIREPVHGPMRPGIQIDMDTRPLGVGLGLCSEKVVPVSEPIVKAVEAAKRAGYVKAGDAMPLLRAKLVDGILHPCQEDQTATQRALVLLATPAGAGGGRELTAGTWDERMDGRVVERDYHPFGDAVGVTVVDELRDNEPWPTQLLVMEPRAQFRVVRNGDLQGRPSEFRVLWTGSTMRIVVVFRQRPGYAAPGEASASV